MFVDSLTVRAETWEYEVENKHELHSVLSSP